MSPELPPIGNLNPAPAAPTGPPECGPATIRYIDRPDMVETFVEFGHRPDLRRTNAPPRVWRHPLG